MYAQRLAAGVVNFQPLRVYHHVLDHHKIQENDLPRHSLSDTQLYQKVAISIEE